MSSPARPSSSVPSSARTLSSPSPFAGAALAAYLLVCGIQLVALLTSATDLARSSQWFAVPLLVLAVAARTRLRSRFSVLAAIGLAWCWAGDTLPDFVPNSMSFVALMGCFLVGHAFFITAFWPSRDRSLLRTRWAIGYAAAAVALVALCASGAGVLLPGVAVYAAALTLTALLATGVDRWAGIGGVLFMFSDALIALGEFVPGSKLPQHDFWVMLTYFAAVGLIAVGVLRHFTRTHTGTRASSVGSPHAAATPRSDRA